MRFFFTYRQRKNTYPDLLSSLFLHLLKTKKLNTISKEQLLLYEVLYLVCCGIQRLPILVLMLMIVLKKAASTEGPSKKSKLILLTATLINFFCNLPLTTWSYILTFPAWNSCLLVVGSLVDVIHICYGTSLVLFFLFLRYEYNRNMEECIWSHVSQIQDTFDFKPFWKPSWWWGGGVVIFLFIFPEKKKKITK